MKTFIAAAIVGLSMATTAWAADPIVGNWRTIADDNGNSGLISVTECGAKICGVLVKSYDKNGKAFQSPNQGRKLIWDMVNTGGGTYAKGKVYSPDRDKTYGGKLQLSGNQLNVQGCVLGICRSGGSWSRVK